MKGPNSTRPAPDEAGQSLASQRVTDQIRQLILAGELAPGSRIRQEQLATRCGTSRIPVREALKRLENEGLVILVPNSSAWVAKLDLRECLETYKIRERLEPLAIGESVVRLTDEQIEEIAALIEQIEQCSDNEKFLELDRKFHLACFQAADMPNLTRLVDRFWNRTQHYRRAFTKLLGEERSWIIHYEHRLLMAAIQRRDADEAESLLRSHIRRTRLELEQHPEIFGPPEKPARRRRAKGG